MKISNEKLLELLSILDTTPLATNTELQLLKKRADANEFLVNDKYVCSYKILFSSNKVP